MSSTARARPSAPTSPATARASGCSTSSATRRTRASTATATTACPSSARTRCCPRRNSACSSTGCAANGSSRRPSRRNDAPPGRHGRPNRLRGSGVRSSGPKHLGLALPRKDSPRSRHRLVYPRNPRFKFAALGTALLLRWAFLVREAYGGPGRRTLRPYVFRHRPGSPDPGYKRTPFIRVDSCPSVVAPSRSDSGAHQEPHCLKQKRGKVGKTHHRFPIRDIREIRGKKTSRGNLGLRSWLK